MNAVKYLGTFAAGVALGVAAGILLAPDSGKKTRKKILDETLKFKDQLADSVSKTVDSLKSSYNKKLEDYSRSGHAALETAKNKLVQ